MRLLGIQRPGPADVMTLANGACGASAILVVMAYSGRPPAELADTGVRLVVVLLLAGTVFDTLDGRFARRGGGTSMGPLLDSLADAVSFGLAPACLVAQVALRGVTGPEQVVVVVGFVVYVSAALLRLADFSSCRHADPRFTGLPSPLAAVLMLSLALLTSSPVVLAAGLAGVGLMMVSRLSYPLQRGPVVALALAGWALGFAGTLGAYDVRYFAVLALVVVGLLPLVAALVSALGPEQRATRSALL